MLQKVTLCLAIVSSLFLSSCSDNTEHDKKYVSIRTITTLFKKSVAEQTDTLKLISLSLRVLISDQNQAQKDLFTTKLLADASHLRNFAYYQAITVVSEGKTEELLVPLAKTMHKIYDVGIKIQDLANHIDHLSAEEIRHLEKVVPLLDQTCQSLYTITSDLMFDIEKEYDVSPIEKHVEEIHRIVEDVTKE